MILDSKCQHINPKNSIFAVKTTHHEKSPNHNRIALHLHHCTLEQPVR